MILKVERKKYSPNVTITIADQVFEMTAGEADILRRSIENSLEYFECNCDGYTTDPACERLFWYNREKTGCPGLFARKE